MPLLVVEKLVVNTKKRRRRFLKEVVWAKADSETRQFPRGRRHQLHGRPWGKRGPVGESAGQIHHVDDGTRLTDKTSAPSRSTARTFMKSRRANLPRCRCVSAPDGLSGPNRQPQSTLTAARAIADPILRLGNGESLVRERCEELAQQVGLPVELLDRFPHQLSTEGARHNRPRDRAQARPHHLDEPTAALMSCAAVVPLLQELKESLGILPLFLTTSTLCGCCAIESPLMQTADCRARPTEQVMVALQASYT